MAFIPTIPVTLVAPVTYYKVLTLHIETPNVAGVTADCVTVTWGAFVNYTDTSPVQTWSEIISGQDLEAMLNTVPAPGLTLYSAIKAVSYTYLQSKNFLPPGTIS